MTIYEMQRAYHKLPAKYKTYGDMPTQVEMQNAIDDCMLFGSHEDIEEFERRAV